MIKTDHSVRKVAEVRLLAVHAHPDDESSKGAASTARYAAAGHEVLVLTCTGGERGEVLNPGLDREPRSMEQMAELRRGEMARSAAILGVQHEWLGFVDSGMDDPSPAGSFAAQPLAVPVAALVEVIRRFRPHVVTTYDENGGYPHPDHLMAHRTTMAAFDAAADPQAFPGTGAPWRALKLYYVQIVTKDRVAAFHEGMIDNGLDSPYADWLATWDDSGNRTITTRVPCDAFYGVRNRALLAHASQIDPDSSWFHVPLAIQQRSWPTEDYEAVLSYVPIADGETSLFAGLAAPVDGSGRGVDADIVDAANDAHADELATRSFLEPAYDARIRAAA